MVHHDVQTNYLLRLAALLEHAGTVRDLMGLEARVLIGRTTDDT